MIIQFLNNGKIKLNEKELNSSDYTKIISSIKYEIIKKHELKQRI